MIRLTTQYSEGGTPNTLHSRHDTNDIKIAISAIVAEIGIIRIIGIECRVRLYSRDAIIDMLGIDVRPCLLGTL